MSRCASADGNGPVLGGHVQRWFDDAYAGEESEGADTRSSGAEESEAEWVARTDEVAQQRHNDASLAASMLGGLGAD